MSKAFTREDDAGLDPVKSTKAAPPLPQTRLGHGALTERLEQARARGDVDGSAALEARLKAGTIALPEDGTVAALGAEVTLRDARERERVVRLVTSDEVGIVARGASPASPIGGAVVGARVGDIVELPPEGGEWTVVRIAWP